MGLENVIPLPSLAALIRDPDWKEDYRQGSFRGVEFKTKSHKYDSGRHSVEHEFPSKEEGNAEDLGKRLPRFNLELYVIGDDYFEQRDALRKALDEEGPGELIHPYLGSQTVQVGKYSVQESVEEGRMARFSVEFVEAGVAKFPSEETDAFQSVLDGADALIAAAIAAFNTGMTVVGFPARVAEAAAALVGDAADLADNVVKKVSAPAQAVADLRFAIRKIKADASELVKTPDKLAAAFQNIYDQLLGAVEDFKSLSKAFSSETSDFEPEPVIGADTPTVEKLRTNQTAMQNFIVNLSVANQAKAAIQGSYISVDESVGIKDLLNQDIEKLLPLVLDDDSFQSLKDLQVSVNLGLPPQNVGEIVRFTPGKILPALVICQRLFGNIAKEQELIDQNKIRHPGFVPGGIPLEVSSE